MVRVLVIAMLVVLASLGPILSPITGHAPGPGTRPRLEPWPWARAGSGSSLRHLTKATEPLALSSKEEAITVSKAQLVHCLNNKLAEFLAWYCCMVSLPS